MGQKPEHFHFLLGFACRLHLYGDIYSSPGLCLAQKQVLMCAFLGEANMHEQLFGHLLAVSSLTL
jgi:hypothetical protein